MITSCMAFYPCLDLAKTEMFYTQVVGLRTVFASDTVRIFHAKQGYFAFVAYGDGKIPRKHLCLSLNCANRESVDAEYQRICALGIQPQSAPAQHPSQPVYSFFLEDPNGYTCLLYTSIDAVRPRTFRDTAKNSQGAQIDLRIIALPRQECIDK